MTELIKSTLNDTVIYRCPDCKCWEYEGRKLRHSRRCDYPTLQPETVAMAEQPKPARESREQYIRRMADSGKQVQPRDWSIVMNRDF